ncbi:MAG: hydrogenase expression/formation protein HypE [Planctomycetota bacterium]
MESPNCPLPLSDYPRVLLAHGGGGLLTRRLVEQIFLPAFRNPALEALGDGAVVTIGGQRIAFTTDSYVARPIFFAGGNIGELAVYGTVNDLAMCAAQPLYLSAGFILEEGFPMEDLRTIVAAMKAAAEACGAALVAGDTKVVERGKGDGLFINTAGIGLVREGATSAPSAIRPGDVLILSGDVGRHGIAMLAARRELAFDISVTSDAAPLHTPVLALLDAGVRVHALRDLTRGGLAAALNELADAAGVTVRADETAVPVTEEVRGACEVLGFDPLAIANEGRFVVFCEAADAEKALALLRAHPVSAGACRIGGAVVRAAAPVILTGPLGATRVLDMPSGELLPRIC